MSIAEAIQTPYQLHDDLYETQYGESDDFCDDESEDFFQDPHLMLQALEHSRQQARDGLATPADEFFEQLRLERIERRKKYDCKS